MKKMLFLALVIGFTRCAIQPSDEKKIQQSYIPPVSSAVPPLLTNDEEVLKYNMLKDKKQKNSAPYCQNPLRNYTMP